MSADLEHRIADALKADDIKSSDLAALIVETEIAAAAADKTAEEEREKALDPLASPNAAKARAAMEDAAFASDRLHTVLPRLQARLADVQAAEYAARWEPDFEQVQARRDELAQEYATTYPRLLAQLVDLFSRAETVDKEISHINGSAPTGEHRRLLGVELTARDLECFTTANPSIASAVQLPDFERSAVLTWPPPTPSLAVQIATSMIQRPHPGANWSEAIAERNLARREDHARVIAHYDAMARQREEREAAEAKKRGREAVS
jgi:hypothetical protein